MPRCNTPISEDTLLDYWVGDLEAGEADRVEEHLFSCDNCSARLRQFADLGVGLATLARAGRVSGIVSRGILNRLQREGFHVRMFSLSPGDTVACSVFPGDDLVVAALRADFSDVDSVTLSISGPEDSPFARLDGVPVAATGGEVLWITPAALIQQLPSMRLALSLLSAGPAPVEIARYVLEHSATAASA